MARETKALFSSPLWKLKISIRYVTAHCQYVHGHVAVRTSIDNSSFLSHVDVNTRVTKPVKSCTNHRKNIHIFSKVSSFSSLLPRIMLRGSLITADSQTRCVIVIYNEFPPLIQQCHTPLCAQIPITFCAVMNWDPISTGWDQHQLI